MRYRFADCEIDLARHVLLRASADVHVEPQVFDLLALVVGSAPDLVSYDDLIAQVWGGRIVSDATLAARISAARAAVGDTGKAQAVIRTIARRGIQLAVPVQGGDTAPEALIATPPEQRQTIRYTTSRDGTGIAYAEVGDGPPLLRGGHWLSHLEHDWKSPIFGPLLRRLCARRRLVRYDPRGTGMSERKLGAATVEHLADDMEAVADAAGLDRFPVFAASQSAPAALILAARRPERVSRLILFSGFVQGASARGQIEADAAVIGLIRSGWGVAGSPFLKAMATLFLPSGTREEVDSLAEMQAISASAEIAADLRGIIGRIDVTGILGRIEAPVLVLHFARDAVQPVEQGRLLARLLPNAELREFDSDSHMGPPSDPVFPQVLDEIDRFLDAEHPPGAA